MAASCTHSQHAGECSMQPLSSDSQAVEVVPRIMAIVHSRTKSLNSQLLEMCQLVMCLNVSGSELAASHPPRVLVQAKHSARKWILDLFGSSIPDSNLGDTHTVPLWDVLAAVSSECTEVWAALCCFLALLLSSTCATMLTGHGYDVHHNKKACV